MRILNFLGLDKMKKIILFIFFIILSCSRNYKEEKKIIFYKDSTFYHKIDSIITNNLSSVKQDAFVRIMENHNNPSSYEDGKIENGIKVGLWKSYIAFRDSIILIEARVYSSKGDLINIKTYDYDTQNIIENKNYRNDELVGIQQEFYPTGELHIKFETDENGNYINSFTIFDKQGKEIFYSNLGKTGTGYIKYYDKDNHIIWEGAFVNKKKEGWHYEYLIGIEGKKLEVQKKFYINGNIITR